MGKKLVLTEKPSVGRDIARVLKCAQGGNGYLAGGQYIVTWALGHLVTLAEPEAYNDKYKQWRLEDLPMLPERMQLIVIRETAKQYNVVRGLLQREDIDELIIATDAGREGELVARWILEKAGWRKPVKRLWISSQTDRAIQDGFRNLRPAAEYDNLYRSAECRAQADWLVGLNITRALTCKHNAQLSAGRVQTPTLAMVVQREEEIRKFIPRDYWLIEARTQGFTLRWRDRKSGQVQLFQKERADEIVKNTSGQMAKVVEITKEGKKELPPLAYDLTELQRDANRRYGHSAKKTLSLLQRLYENHKLVTYPRTDSRYLTQDMVATLPERLRSIAVGPYTALAQGILRSKLNITSRLVDNTKVSDHHAIIPTEEFVNLNALEREEKQIYDLIVRRFLAALSQPFEYEQTTVQVEAAGECFSARGKVVRSKGWKAVYEEQEAEEEDEADDGREQSLPALQQGQTLRLEAVRAINRKTKPPARHTEATLLSAMEHPGKFLDDTALCEMVNSTGGLGTPATRADIIEKLFDSFYMERKGKEIHPTSKGIQLVKLVPADLKSPELTAKWEQQLSQISKGKVDPKAFIREMRTYASSLVGKVVAGSETFRHDNLTREKCPECGKFLLDVTGKKGKMLVCSDRACGYRKGVSRVSNARCPQCHKKMEMRGEGEDTTFACICGHREKLSAFKQRKGEQVNKREVSRFLKEQEEDSPINSALAEALKKWNGK